MDFLKKLKSIGRSRITLDASLGNVLVTGNSKHGAEVVMRNYAIDSVNRGYGLVIIRDVETGMAAYPSIASSSRMIYDLDCTDNSVTDQIDVLSGMNDNEINAFIIKLFDIYSEIDKSKKMSFQNYIATMRTLCKKAGKHLTFNNFADYPIEEIDVLNMRYCSGIEQSRNDRFLNSLRGNIQDLESYFADFSNNVAGYVLSGTKTLEQIFKTKPIVEVGMDFGRKPEESLVVATALIDTISRFNLSSSSVKSINVIVDGAPNETLIGCGLQKLIRGGRGFNVLYTIQDISNLVEQSNEWIDYADSYFFFRQNSNKNKEFCSEFFGTYEKQKRTTTKGVSNPSFLDRLSGRGAASKQTGVSITTEKERVYLPDVFASLPENQAVYYDKKSNFHTYLNVF